MGVLLNQMVARACCARRRVGPAKRRIARVVAMPTVACDMADASNVVSRRRRPRFVFPVFKDKGAFYMLMGEWQDNSLILTYLEHYKRDPNSAEPCVAAARVLFPAAHVTHLATQPVLSAGCCSRCPTLPHATPHAFVSPIVPPTATCR